MPDRRTIPWWKLDQLTSDLNTDLEHELRVQKEAIPLILIPGIMGTRLRLTGTREKEGDKGPDNLPNIRWDPRATVWAFKYILGASGAKRKKLLVGEKFSGTYLEPTDALPIGDGFRAILDDYIPFLKKLKKGDWAEPLDKIFEFPVYAVGYNWSDDVRNSGAYLSTRIDAIVQEAAKVTGLCEKVILITHSMGGLVARWASEQAGKKGSILGIVHTVQPVDGAAAAYWRIKAGFERGGFLDLPAKGLGDSGDKVTPVLGNIPGGLELLPNKSYVNNRHKKAWLNVTDKNGQVMVNLPEVNPYQEIYRIQAVVKPAAGEKPSRNRFWGLVDADLLDPAGNAGRAATPGANQPNSQLDAAAPPAGAGPFDIYLQQLKKAELFHDDLKHNKHANTRSLRGTGFKTTDAVELKIRAGSAKEVVYKPHGFTAHLTNQAGEYQIAELQNPAGRGDQTVSEESAGALAPPLQDLKVDHQTAFKDKKVQEWVFNAIIDLCKIRYEEKRGKSKPAGTGH
jgi:pimeloyl-ACP methyl ester carboxylesterase